MAVPNLGLVDMKTQRLVTISSPPHFASLDLLQSEIALRAKTDSVAGHRSPESASNSVLKYTTWKRAGTGPGSTPRLCVLWTSPLLARTRSRGGGRQTGRRDLEPMNALFVVWLQRGKHLRKESHVRQIFGEQKAAWAFWSRVTSFTPLVLNLDQGLVTCDFCSKGVTWTSGDWHLDGLQEACRSPQPAKDSRQVEESAAQLTFCFFFFFPFLRLSKCVCFGKN